MIGHSMLKTNNDRVQLNEVFTSIEGEGPYFGTKTIFVRMSGCHLNCHWCDTTYALAMNSGTNITVDEAKDLIMKELQPNTYKINFTGGEPLIQHEAVAELAKFMKQKKGLRTYIESSCFDSLRFAKVLPHIDICKVEFKMSDSEVVDHDSYNHLLLNQIRCLKLAVMQRKKTYVKVVVTGSSNIHEFRNLVKEIFENAEPSNLVGFVIQPCAGVDEPTVEKLLSFYDCVYPMYDEVRIVPQLHKLMGVR
jgi:7-carboxy-7-deazaguanine synthase